MRENQLSREPGPLGESNSSNTSRFNPGDIGFFDPFYDNKSIDTGSRIEYTGKETFFRDIIIFINRNKDISRTKGTELVRSNLQAVSSRRSLRIVYFTAHRYRKTPSHVRPRT